MIPIIDKEITVKIAVFKRSALMNFGSTCCSTDKLSIIGR